MAFNGEPVLLLVEDDADDQRFFQWAIRKSELSISLRLARDGEEAIEYLSHLPDRLFLILCDVHLPKKSGWDVLLWIRRRTPWARLPVLIWTSLPNPEGEIRAQQLGATSYFTKPMTTEGYRKLVGVIGDYLRD
jgi:two-component system response regulator